jgi:hypothetical protein
LRPEKSVVDVVLRVNHSALRGLCECECECEFECEFECECECECGCECE